MNTLNTENYKPREFAKLMKVSVKTLQRWDRDRILVAHRTATNRRYYTYEQYLQYRNIDNRVVYPSMITRGNAYTIVRNTLKSNSPLNPVENAVFLQQIIDQILEMPPCWPDGVVMKQTARLDADLIQKRDIRSILSAYAKNSEWTDGKNICKTIMEGLQ